MTWANVFKVLVGAASAAVLAVGVVGVFVYQAVKSFQSEPLD
jgi:hypothetical protein